MKKALKWVGIILGGLIGLIAILAGVLFALGNSKINRAYAVTPAAIAVPHDAEALQRGEYAFRTYCSGCHGPDGGGTEFFVDPAAGAIHAPNLTAGEGGIGTEYTDADYIRAIRHGVRPSGEGLAIMPSQAFWHFSDEELGAIIAYLKTLPPVDRTWEARMITPVSRILIGAGLMDVFAAEHLDHTARPDDPLPGVTAEYGKHLVNTADCRLCHGQSLSGGAGPEPGAPPGPNLTPSGGLAGWTAEDFIAAMRTGVTPSGYELDPHYMPWESIGKFNDDDLTAIFLYLQSLQASETAQE